MSKVRQNITVDPEVLDEFYKIAAKKGIKLSSWINIKMQEFIDEYREQEKTKGTP